ncbi:MAG TPA: FlgD immunoglobulin-like domain containing protein [bacterium]
MKILILHIFIVLNFLMSYQANQGIAGIAGSKNIYQAIGSDNSATASIAPQYTTIDTSFRLVQPGNRSQVFTFAPKFSWRPLQAREKTDYRLIISDTNGKIVFNEWIGSDTSFTLPASNRLIDLNTYYWTVYAQVDSQQRQSAVWSFWIDQEIGTDLVVKDLVLLNSKDDWNAGDIVQIQAIVENSGPKDAGQCFVKLFSGNVNRNYFDYFAYRKTIAIDTVTIDSLRVNIPKTVVLSARIPYGFNHFFVTIEPGFGAEEIIDLNNQKSGIRIQTENRTVNLDGLFVFYSNNHHPEIGERRLSKIDIEKIFQNIVKLQQYAWDHTQILHVSVDTLHIDRFLQEADFTYQDNQWGYFLTPDRVIADLTRRYQTSLDYDFIFVFYSWWNTPAYWSGYSGYTFNSYKINDKNIAFLAQPQYQDQIEKGEVTIHEFIHLLDHLFQVSGESMFYSPHQRTVFSTFDNDQDYNIWILETLPSDRWFYLKQGQILHRSEITGFSKANKGFVGPNNFVLFQNLPNPFHQTTTIRYKIPPIPASKQEGAKVTLCLYDVLGNHIKTLVNEQQRPGFYQALWDGTDNSGNAVSSGLYFYQLKIGEWRQVKKMLCIR